MASHKRQHLTGCIPAKAVREGCAAPPRQTGRTQRSLLPVAAAAALLERVQEVATEAQKPVTISISTHFQAAFGEGLKVVGSHPALGEWDVAAAPDMQWTPGHKWVANVAVPAQSELEFKIVHLTYGGVAWEPSGNRPLVAAYGDAEVPEEAALEVECAFGYPELTAVQLARAADVAANVDHAEGSWDPAAQGLPADLTDDLSKQVLKAVKEESAAAEAMAETSTLPASTSWEAIKQSAPEFLAEPASADPAAHPGSAAAFVKTPAKDATSSMQAVGKAASFAAVGLAAGVLMSALAIDITDAAVASAIFAAGATLLPAKDAKVAQRAAGTVLSGGLNATEAIARGFGLRSHAERRAEAEGVRQLQGGSAEEAVQFQDVAEAERRLAASIAEAEALLSESGAVNNALLELDSEMAAGATVAGAAMAAVNFAEEKAEEAC